MKPTEDFTGNISTDTTLTADKNYLMKGVVHVEDGATLTIEPGTVIFGEKASKASLIVSQGGRIHAEGTPDLPIVFTSELPIGQRAAGDWGGLVLLGRAPINEGGGMSSIEGFTTTEPYGGNMANDSSGVLKYVRIEFSGIEIDVDNEINGLTLGGVGSGTEIDFIQVRHTLDDCFEFFGGTVNAKHLVCYRNGDDGFDMDEGYVGKLQFLYFQSTAGHGEEDNGFECDNDQDVPDLTPLTNPTIYNVTLCGQNGDTPKQQYGFLFRRGFNGTIGNAIVSGFEAAVDFRNKPFTSVTVTNSVFFGNAPENIAYAELGTMAPEDDDDAGFDERGWFTGDTTNSEADPMLADCFADNPDPRPAATIAAEAPPNDGFFDTTATYKGAFKDPTDTWMSGGWLDWSQN
jgi:hypothetical protein